jgi:uncharacterized protein
MNRVVLDTNVFVATGFNQHSHSAGLLEMVRRGELRMIWSDETQDETRHILKKIPLLRWDEVSDLFHARDHFTGTLDLEQYNHVDDPSDRKFLALAEVTGSALISNDEHLLAHADRATVPVLTPSQFLKARRT